MAIVAGVSLAADAPATEKGLRWTAPTDSGRWKVTLTTDATTLQPRRFVTFSLEVRDADGAMVDTPMTFQIGGGMDAHGHGLPTQPQVTDRLGAGRFRLEGVRFNMPGAWQLRVAMRTAAATETVTFQLEVDP